MANIKETLIFKRSNLKQAAQLLKEGKLVAFPTETVFGLGAIANNKDAVGRVFNVKGRPSDNPLIVHISHQEEVELYASEITSLQKELMERFWPGPLTIIFNIKDNIFPDNVCGGGSTLAMRMPAQLETLLLINMVGFPLVGPSANISGKPSPTMIDHVLADFAGKIEGVIDPQTKLTDIGVESTVVKVEGDTIFILRPGAITKDMIQGQVRTKVVELSKVQQIQSKKLQSPGVKYRHYSPKQPVLLMKYNSSLEDWRSILNKYKNLGILANQKIIDNLSCHKNILASYSLGEEGDTKTATQRLYAGLRALESSNCHLIVAETFKDTEDSHAYMNRILATGHYNDEK